MTDGHYPTYAEMLRKVKWESYGVVNGVARDSRCEHCMVHCGYDPSGALGTNYQRGDNWKNVKYNFGAKPKPHPWSADLEEAAFNGVARDARCENCMVHCGYDPSGALGTNYQRGDNWKNIKYNFSAKPKPYPKSAELEKAAFNGVSVGKGHLAQAKAVVNKEFGGAKSGSVAEQHKNSDGSCSGENSTPDTEMLNALSTAKKVEVKSK